MTGYAKFHKLKYDREKEEEEKYNSAGNIDVQYMFVVHRLK